MAELKFVDRERERWKISASSHQLMLIDAPAGYGKTRLLRAVKEDFEKEGWKCAFVDLRSLRTEVEFQNELRKQICLQLGISIYDDRALDSDWYWKSHIGASGDKLMLMVDSVSEDPAGSDIGILRWFLVDFIPSATQSLGSGLRFRVIIAGRYMDKRKVLAAHFKSFLRVDLEPFEDITIYRELVVDAIEKYPPPNRTFSEGDYDAWAKLLLGLSGQHPGLIADLIQYAFAGKWILPTQPEEKSQTLKALITKHLTNIKQTIDPETCRVLDYLFVFRLFFYQSIEILEQHGYIPGYVDAARIFQQLIAYGLIEKSDFNPFYSDKLVRNLFLLQLRLFDTETYKTLNQIAQEFYENQLHSYLSRLNQSPIFADEFTKACVLESLYHCFELYHYSRNGAYDAQRLIGKHSSLLEKALGPSVEDPGRRIKLKNWIEQDTELSESIENAGLSLKTLDTIRSDFATDRHLLQSEPMKQEPNSAFAEELDKQQRSLLREALGEAHKISDITLILADMGIEMEKISSGKNRVDTIVDIVEYCRKEHRLAELAKFAYIRRPENPYLKDFVKQHFPEWLVNQPSSKM